MKIGILTHHYVKNFGAYMQEYALLSVIKSKYPYIDIELVNFKIKKHEFINSKHFFGFKPWRGDTIKGWIEKIKLFFMHKKYESYLPISRKVNSAEEVDKIKYDLIIVGSDEVWNFNDISFSPVKFGVGIKTPIIAYSASIGGSSAQDKLPDNIINGINKFMAISVRDLKTEQLVMRLTRKKVIRSLDPVYLYDYNLKCSTQIKNLVKEKKYILIYDCHLTFNQKEILISYVKANNMNIFGAGEYRNWYSSLKTVNITPNEWAYLFKNAWGIITGTFHGTSFAIKYNKKFIVYLTEQNRINKVKSLLEELQLLSQLVMPGKQEQLVDQLEQDIDYLRVNQIIEKKKKDSLQYLFTQIEMIERQRINNPKKVNMYEYSMSEK